MKFFIENQVLYLSQIYVLYSIKTSNKVIKFKY